ncbi:MAG: anti-sigma factor [Actinomycetota bacterium]
MKRTLVLLVAALAALLLAPLTASAQSGGVAVSFSGLEPLGPNAVYEGWLIIDGAPQSTGTFNIDADGNVALINSATTTNIASATAYVLTIEPANDPDPAPSATHVLAGDVVDGRADLTISHPAALGTDFASAGGSFIVAAPTTETTDDDLSGVWFLDPTGADGPVASLDLPALPEGWAYEGWVVVDGTPVSTGRFTDASGPDDFSGFSGPADAPPYPGEDLVANAPAGLSFPTDLSGATVVISVEPDPDDGPAPFALKPLVGEIPADVEVGALNSLGDGPVAITGVALIGGQGGADELAFTGAETWYLAGGAAVLVAVGAAFVLVSRRQLAA